MTERRRALSLSQEARNSCWIAALWWADTGDGKSTSIQAHSRDDGVAWPHALQLERRFGPIEFGLRSEAGKPLYVDSPSICRVCAIGDQPRFNWFWTNGLQAEGWFNDSLSLGLSYAWNLAFGFPVPSEQVAFAPRDSNGNPLSPTFVSTSATVTGRVFFTWAITRLVGLSLDLSTTQPPFFSDRDGVQRVRFPFLSLGSWADNATVFFLGFWFRTDAALARNWIER